MRGATAEELRLKMSNIPIRDMIINTGISQNFFLTFKKAHNSLTKSIIIASKR